MGDHRASIKIEMEFHGVKDSCDMWINYSPDSSDYFPVDQRIIDFIEYVYERGMSEYHKRMDQYDQESRRRELEEKERKELKRLKDKYESP